MQTRLYQKQMYDQIPFWQEIPVENFYAQISNVNVQNLKKKKFWIFFSFSAEKKVSISNGNDISWLLVSYSKSRLQPTSAAQSVPPVSIFCILNVLNFIFKHEFTLCFYTSLYCLGVTLTQIPPIYYISKSSSIVHFIVWG